jgi:hypothetical protein
MQQARLSSLVACHRATREEVVAARQLGEPEDEGGGRRDSQCVGGHHA